MNINIYQVDAFTSKLFEGNPAAVCPLDEWLTDQTMQDIATENNLSETAFFISDNDHFKLRWFTPKGEVDLCGHATLATAHVLYNHLGRDQSTINFLTKSGKLRVKKEGSRYVMDFPADKIEKTHLPDVIKKSINTHIVDTYKGNTDYLLVIDSEEELLTIKPDFRQLMESDCRGVIVTAPGISTDFVSRCFYPVYGIDEDPVTGSAHTTMIPYWSQRLNKQTLSARQLSPRGGDIACKYLEERVEISGEAITFMQGLIEIG